MSIQQWNKTVRHNATTTTKKNNNNNGIVNMQQQQPQEQAMSLVSSEDTGKSDSSPEAIEGIVCDAPSDATQVAAPAQATNTSNPSIGTVAKTSSHIVYTTAFNSFVDSPVYPPASSVPPIGYRGASSRNVSINTHLRHVVDQYQTWTEYDEANADYEIVLDCVTAATIFGCLDPQFKARWGTRFAFQVASDTLAVRPEWEFKDWMAWSSWTTSQDPPSSSDEYFDESSDAMSTDGGDEEG